MFPLLLIFLNIYEFDLEPNSVETQKWMHYLVTEQEEHIGQTLNLILPNITEMIRFFNEEKVPSDFVWLALIEPPQEKRTSRAGLYSFNIEDALKLGFVVNDQVDQRFHPLKAAQIVAQYFKNLYRLFSNWNLCLAAHYLGPELLWQFMQKHQFSAWTDTKLFLPQEGLDYVAKAKASILIGKQSLQLNQKSKQPPEQTVPDPPTEKTEPEPAEVTPPPPPPKIQYHVVAKGDSLFQISKTYNVPLQALIQENRTSNNLIKIGQKLRIPHISKEENQTTLTPKKELKKDPRIYDTEPESQETQKWVKFLEGERASQTAFALKNAARYVPSLKPYFKQEEVPETLVWLAMIESSFRPSPQNPSGATGMFQFKAATGRLFGLKVNRHIDERNNPQKAAHAAARYLKYLYNKFQDWDLTLAAYNLGEGDLRRTMTRKGARTWVEVKPYVRKETQNYVGKIKAAIIIGERFLENYHPETQSSTAQTHLVAKGDTLYSIAKSYGRSVAELKSANKMRNNSIQLGQSIMIPPIYRKVVYVVRKGDTLNSIARKHKIPLKELMETNNLRRTRIKQGQSLIIPKQE